MLCLINQSTNGLLSLRSHSLPSVLQLSTGSAVNRFKSNKKKTLRDRDQQ